MIDLFSRDEFVATFAKTFLMPHNKAEMDKSKGGGGSEQEHERNTLLVHQFYNRLAMDCLESLPIYVAHLANVQQCVSKRFEHSNAMQVWQLRLLGSLLVMQNSMLKQNPAEMIRALQMRLEMLLKDLMEDTADGNGSEFRQQLEQSYAMAKGDRLKWLGTLEQRQINRLLFAQQFQGRRRSNMGDENEVINLKLGTKGAFMAQLLDMMERD